MPRLRLRRPGQIDRVVVTDVAGTEHEIQVVDGWLAFAGNLVTRDGNGTSPGGLHFAVYAADGSVLAEYDEAV